MESQKYQNISYIRYALDFRAVFFTRIPWQASRLEISRNCSVKNFEPGLQNGKSIWTIQSIK